MNEAQPKGWADKLFAWFSKDVKTTGLVLLTAMAVYQQNKIDNLQKEKQELSDKWVERVIVEVEKRQDPKFKDMENRIDTVRMAADSSRKDIQTTTEKVRSVAGKIEKALNRR
jgi:hypothetical protein